MAQNEEVAIEVVNVELNRLRGYLFETIEAVGLPDRQQEAIKRLIRRQSFTAQNLIVSALRGEYFGDGSRP